MMDLLVRNLDLPVIWIPGPRQVKPTEQQLYCSCPCKSNCVGECVSLITTTTATATVCHDECGLVRYCSTTTNQNNNNASATQLLVISYYCVHVTRNANV
jgi:hypothetical protein